MCSGAKTSFRTITCSLWTTKENLSDRDYSQACVPALQVFSLTLTFRGSWQCHGWLGTPINLLYPRPEHDSKYKSVRVSHLASSYPNMHRAVGPLTIGTYIPIITLNGQDHVPKVERSGSGYAMASTKNKNDPNVEVRTISTPICILHLSSLVVSFGEPGEWSF